MHLLFSHFHPPYICWVTNTQQDKQQQGMDINSYTRPTANNFNFNKFEFEILKSDNFNNLNKFDISSNIVPCSQLIVQCSELLTQYIHVHRDNSKLEETAIVFLAIGDCQLL
jgi:hypothetical protein